MSNIKTVDEFIQASQNRADKSDDRAYAIGRDLGLAMINHVSTNIFIGNAIIIAVGLFDDAQSLSEKIDTVPFFKDNRLEIIGWLKRCTPNDNPTETSTKLATTLTNVFGCYFSPKEVQAVVFEDDKTYDTYNNIADACTKMVARSLALWFVKDHTPTPPTFS